MRHTTLPTEQAEFPSLIQAVAQGYHFCHSCRRVVTPLDDGRCALCGAFQTAVEFYPAIPKP